MAVLPCPWRLWVQCAMLSGQCNDLLYRLNGRLRSGKMRISHWRALKIAKGLARHWYSSQAVTAKPSRKPHSTIIAGEWRHVTTLPPWKKFPCNLSTRYAIGLKQCRSPPGKESDLGRRLLMIINLRAGGPCLLKLVSFPFNVQYAILTYSTGAGTTLLMVWLRSKYAPTATSCRHLILGLVAQ